MFVWLTLISNRKCVKVFTASRCPIQKFSRCRHVPVKIIIYMKHKRFLMVLSYLFYRYFFRNKKRYDNQSTFHIENEKPFTAFFRISFSSTLLYKFQTIETILRILRWHFSFWVCIWKWRIINQREAIKSVS